MTRHTHTLLAVMLALLFGVAPALAVSPESESKFRYLRVTKDIRIAGTGITSANINTGAVKRKILIVKPCPGGGVAAANSTVYFEIIYPGRAGVVKNIAYATNVDPVSGTNTIKVLKGSSAGNTMLSTASVSLNGTTANTATAGTLTSTAADLSITAAQGIYCEYSAGTQGAAAKDVTVVVEFEPTDY